MDMVIIIGRSAHALQRFNQKGRMAFEGDRGAVLRGGGAPEFCATICHHARAGFRLSGAGKTEEELKAAGVALGVCTNKLEALSVQLLEADGSVADSMARG